MKHPLQSCTSHGRSVLQFASILILTTQGVLWADSFTGSVNVLNNQSYTAGTNGITLNPGNAPELNFVRSNGSWGDTWWNWSMGGDNKLRLGFSTVPQLTFQNGAVGIGTDSPLVRLHVNGTQLIENGMLDLRSSSKASDSWPFRIASNETSGWNELRINRIGSSRTWVLQTSEEAISFPSFSIQPSGGNVGIGTTTPSGKLTVVGSAGDARSITLDSREIKFRGDGIAHMSILGPINGKPYLSIGDTSTSYLTGSPSSEVLVVGSNGKVGIGTTAPDVPLTIGTTGGNGIAGHLINATGPFIQFTDLGSKDWAIGVPDNSKALAFFKDRNVSAAGSETMRIDDNGNVGIGTTNPTNKLEVNGTIRTKEVIVETNGWADHVLAKGYLLAPLAEVEAHIASTGTLPGIPSASDVAAHGVSVGDMQAKLLAKLEELTLHQIAQEKEIQRLRAEVAQLRRSTP